MKSIFYILLFLTFVSCSDNKKVHKPQNNTQFSTNDHDGETRYTFSKNIEVDFVVSSGTYSILFDYSKPIDTLFDQSGAHLIGMDSIVYLRIRKDNSDPLQEKDANMYYGSTENLVLYNGKSFKILNLPYFNKHFSAFTVKEKYIYYWGFPSQDGHLSGKMLVCKYNLNTKKLVKKEINYYADTDFFGHFDPPYFDGPNKIIFQTENGDFWAFDSNNLKLLNEEIKEPII